MLKSPTPFFAFALSLTAVLLVVPTQAQVILYVDQDAPPGGDGFSWATAYDDLAEPFNLAVFNIIFRVAEGTYTPDCGTGDRNATFRMKSTIRIEGGYAGISEPNPDSRDVQLYETILSGDLLNDDGPDFTNTAENSYRVVSAPSTDESAVLDGFTISGGNADGTRNGAGLFVSGGDYSSTAQSYYPNTT